MKIHRSDEEPLANKLKQKRAFETGKSVDLMIALFDRLIPNCFLHVTIIGDDGGGVSVSRTSDTIPDEMRSRLEDLNNAFAKDLATIFGGDARATTNVVTDGKPGSLAAALEKQE